MRRHCPASTENVGYSCGLGVPQTQRDRVKYAYQVPER